MTTDELKNILEITKITVGFTSIIEAFYSNNYWFYLGAIPLLAGVLNLCVVNLMSKKQKK